MYVYAYLRHTYITKMVANLEINFFTRLSHVLILLKGYTQTDNSNTLHLSFFFFGSRPNVISRSNF